jgi:hypothetical protein
MKIEIIKDQVEEDETYYKEVTVYGKQKGRRGMIPDSIVTTASSDDLNIDIISEYLEDDGVDRIVILYKPEAAETINGVDIFYSPIINWDSELEFTVYGEGEEHLHFIDFGDIDNLALLQVLATIQGAVCIKVEE